MQMRALTLGFTPVIAALVGCSEPDANLVVKAVSPDGKRVIAAYHVVPGSILDEHLVLTVAPASAAYRPDDSVASFAKVTELRAYWTADGRPVIIAKTMDGAIFDGTPELIACVGSGANCAQLKPRGREVMI